MGAKGGTRTQSEPGAKGKIELVTLLAQLVAGDRDAKIEAEGRTGHEEAQPEAEVIVVAGHVEIVGPPVHEAGVIEESEPDRADDIEGVFRAEKAIGLTADGLIELIARGYLAELEAAEGRGTAQVPFVVVRDVVRIAEVLDDAAPGDQAQHLRLGLEDREELGTAELDAVVVVDLAAAERSTGKTGVHFDAIAGRGVDDLVARVALQLQAEAGRGIGPLQGPDDGGGARGDVLDVEDLVGVGKPAVPELEQVLAEVDLEAGLDLAVEGAVVLRAGAEDAEALAQLPLEEPGLLEGKDHFAGQRTELHAQAELLAVALEEGATVEKVEIRL